MTGRIALMVRGLPPIPLENVSQRLGKYYKIGGDDIVQPKEFHNSKSFKSGYDYGGEIAFTNKDGGMEGGGGLNKQVMEDLRKLQTDFEKHIESNPNIYTNKPTSPSRAKLYRRALGFQGEEFQALDARRIAQEDLPYTQALDPKVLDPNISLALGNPKQQAFVRMPDGTIRSLDRFDRRGVKTLLRDDVEMSSKEYVLNKVAKQLRG